LVPTQRGLFGDRTIDLVAVPPLPGDAKELALDVC
jgi:hypothetical protein